MFERSAALSASSSQHASTPSSAIATMSSQPHPNAAATERYSIAEIEVGERRVVGVQRGQQPGLAHLRVHVVLEPAKALAIRTLEFGHTVRGIRSSATRAVELRILEDREAVVDALDAEHVDARGDRRRPAVLALVRGQPEAGRAGHSYAGR